MTTRNPNMPTQRPTDAGRAPRPVPDKAPSRDTPKPSADPAEHEGAVETEIGDRTGPGAGYDDEPEQEQDGGGVS